MSQTGDSKSKPLFNTGYSDDEPAVVKAFRYVDAAVPPKARSGRRIVVCRADELPPGSRRIVDDGKQGIGVFNVGGTLYALKNVCPHAGAELCRGTLHATHRPGDAQRFDPDFDGRVLRCPWHGWEFELASGKGLYDAKSRVATYAVEVDEAGDVVVML